MSERMDLDGLRIIQPGGQEVWLIYHGRRHYVADPDVYQCLFKDENLLVIDGISEIDVGPVLNSGTCLVQGSDDLAIYLVTGEGANIRRFHISSYESFLNFGFNEEQVKVVPSIVINGVPAGRPLSSAADRAARLLEFQDRT